MSTLPPGLAESALQAIQGLPVWEHLPGGGTDTQPGDSHQRTKAAFRATSRTLRGLADGLIKELGQVCLGQQFIPADGTYEPDFAEHASCWNEGQQLQQQRVKAMLGRLVSLQGVQICLSRGGLSQLVQLVQEGLLARVKELRLHQVVESDPAPEIPNGLLAGAMPLLEDISMCLLSSAAPLLAGLPGCTRLRYLLLSGAHLPPGFFADLAGCSSLRSLLLQHNNVSVPADVAQLTQLTRLSSCGPLDLASVSALTGLQQLELGTLEGMVGPASLTALTALTGLKLGSGLGRDIGWLQSNAALELAANLWQELQSLTSLAWLELGRAVCKFPAMWTSPSAWHHQHLTQLTIHLETVLAGPWNEQSTASLPALQHLHVKDADEGCIGLEPLHLLLHAAPNLVSVRLSAYLDYHGTATTLGVNEATRLLGEVCRRLGGLQALESCWGVPTIGIHVYNALGEEGGDNDSDDEGGPQQQIISWAQQLMSSLQPLAAVGDLKLHLDIVKVRHHAVAALHSALPDLGSLCFQPANTITLRALQLLPRFRCLRYLKLPHLLPATEARAIHMLESLQLERLDAQYNLNIGLIPWVHSRQHCALPTLRALTLNCSSHLSLQDLHYLLHAAANLESLCLSHDQAGIEISSRGGMYSPADLLQQLLDVLSRLAQLKVSLPSNFWLRLQRDAMHDATPVLKAVTQFLGKLARPPSELELDFWVEFTPEAARALVSGLPQVEQLKLRSCRIGQPAVLASLAKLGRLESIVLMDVAGPVELALYLAMFRVTAPAVEVEVHGCGWWTARYQEGVERGLVAFHGD